MGSASFFRRRYLPDVQDSLSYRIKVRGMKVRNMFKYAVMFITSMLFLFQTSESMALTNRDSEVLSGLIAGALTDIVGTQARIQDGKTVIVYSPARVPGDIVKRMVEASLTALGHTISKEASNGTSRCEIMLSDAAVSLKKRDGRCHRTVSVTVHVRWTNDSGEILAADYRTKTASDNIGADECEKTDDCGVAIEGLTRTSIEKGRITTRIVSFLILSGTLIYFAFQ